MSFVPELNLVQFRQNKRASKTCPRKRAFLRKTKGRGPKYFPGPRPRTPILILLGSQLIATLSCSQPPLVSQAWKAETIPDTWKKAVTILIHKKDTTDNPSHLRPITLQCTALKVMTSFTRNRIFEFLSQNGYVENNIQKGFTPKVAGTIEHTAHMGHLIRHAKKHKMFVISRYVGGLVLN